MESIVVVKLTLFCITLLLFVRPMGAYLFRVFESRERPLPVVFGPLERASESLCGVEFSKEQSWSEYAGSLLTFSACSLLATYLILRCQEWLPFNDGHLPGLSPGLAFNTAVSFATNTNWQAYAGETTMSLLSQAVGLAWHNFLSAAVGFCAFLVLARGLLRTYPDGQKRTMGNFWADLTRGLLYVFIPFCLILSLLYVASGVPQTFVSSRALRTLEGKTIVLPLGLVASQEAAKILGVNGGGFFNANSAHPFENPTPVSNLLTMWAILLIPAGSTCLFGLMAGNTRQGWGLLAAMLLIFLAGALVCMSAEGKAPPWCGELKVDGTAGNLEGKEVRFGAFDSALFAVVTTGASCGAVNSMHDSYSPLGGLVPLLMIQLGEIVFGGVGSGTYGIIVFAILSVFVAGLMVGRTPEYLAKKIDVREMKIVMLYLLIFPTLVLVFSGWSAVAPYALSSLANKGPHGFSEILYAYSSAVGNNGSAFAGLNADTGWFNGTLGLAMLAGRFWMMIPILALGGSFALKRTVPVGPGTFPTDGLLFVLLLVSIVLIFGALTFFPPLLLGPVLEQFLAAAGRGVLTMKKSHEQTSLLDLSILNAAIRESVRKLSPALMVRNPVMFIVEVGCVLTTALFARDLLGASPAGAPPLWFTGWITVWLWFTVLFANFAEAMAEGRGKAQADSLRRMRHEITARRLSREGSASGGEERVPASALRKGDLVVCEAGDFIPGDGDVIEGIAFVDESAITGESAPVIRESGGDRSAVTGGTRVLSDRIVVRISVDPGCSFLDRMIGLVEGSSRQKTPNELALHILLVGLTFVFLVVCVTLVPMASYAGVTLSPTILVALLVCLIPTTIGGLLSAIGIAGMDRLLRKNVLAMSGRAVEAAGDVDTLMLDKTGTITLGNRVAVAIFPVRGVLTGELAEASQLASLADETPEGRSIIVFLKETYALRAREIGELEATFVPFTAQTRMSGCDLPGRQLRKGAVEAVIVHVRRLGGEVPPEAAEIAGRIADEGGTPLAVADGARLLGIIHLKDMVKDGIRERFERFRMMGIKTVMITGDNPRTAAAVGREAGVDDVLAEATPETKMGFIRAEQARGKLVAMTGDGTNDAPALAQADVGVAMNTGTQAAKEAGNMIDLDSNPTKLLEVVEIGKQLLMTRGALTTFSIANDLAKYFAILPAMFGRAYPEVLPLNVMRLASPESAILSAVIFNALIIMALIPLALRGVEYRPLSAERLLPRLMGIYGLGGVIAPFLGIKGIDLVLVAVGLAY